MGRTADLQGLEELCGGAREDQYFQSSGSLYEIRYRVYLSRTGKVLNAGEKKK